MLQRKRERSNNGKNDMLFLRKLNFLLAVDENSHKNEENEQKEEPERYYCLNVDPELRKMQEPRQPRVPMATRGVVKVCRDPAIPGFEAPKRVCEMAAASGYNTIMSHRSGETEDSTLADLAVALGSPFIKSGAPCRSERLAKYNRLLTIESCLGATAKYGSARIKMNPKGAVKA